MVNWKNKSGLFVSNENIELLKEVADNTPGTDTCENYSQLLVHFALTIKRLQQQPPTANHAQPVSQPDNSDAQKAIERIKTILPELRYREKTMVNQALQP